MSSRVRPALAAALLLAASAPALAATPAPAGSSGYQLPPGPIPAMIDAQPTPNMLVSGDHRRLLIVGRENLPSVAALAQPILRLAGWRVNPRTNGPAEIRMNWFTSMAFQEVAGGPVRTVTLPKGMRFTAPNWSPDDTQVAFVAEAPAGLELWVADARGGAARRLTAPMVNAAMGFQLDWAPDGRSVLFTRTLEGRRAAPAVADAPEGPTVQENIGRARPTRTYEDLLANAHDEALFEYYFTSQLVRVPVSGGAPQALGAPGVISSFDVSPDGRHILVERLHRPFSYLVPSDDFPTEIAVWDAATGRPEKVLTDRPLNDDQPIAFDAVPAGPRRPEWRADAPATLVWAEAQDGGDPNRTVPVHDRVLMLDAPFTGQARTLADLPLRYARIDWGRKDAALVSQRWWRNRREVRLLVDPSNPGAASRTVIDRNYQDQFADPGRPLTVDGPLGRPVMAFAADGAVLMSAPGATREGERPFLAKLDLATGKETELWRAEPTAYEQVLAVLDPAGGSILTRRESATEPPNAWVRPTAAGGAAARQLTRFADPEPQFAGVTKQLVAYKRADGVDLSGTLYLPAGYDRSKGPLPMLMWAYPTEFTDPKVAGQVVDRTKNRFTRPSGISHLYLLTQGYAILDGFSAPIIGAAGAEANDTYIDQLTADAKAAVDAVVAMGVADRDRIGVGGHSYGAFMTANLLAHSDLFRAGIARSGAYNRTLTPFGFQAEQRTYWQAPAVYNAMSPFAFAPQIKAPILLIHGEADDNSGTFPVQSERMYAALKGAGATVRYVTLPNEPHGYRGRESTLHTLWEMTRWMDAYVKNAPPRAAGTRAE